MLAVFASIGVVWTILHLLGLTGLLPVTYSEMIATSMDGRHTVQLLSGQEGSQISEIQVNLAGLHLFDHISYYRESGTIYSACWKDNATILIYVSPDLTIESNRANQIQVSDGSGSFLMIFVHLKRP